METVGAKPTKRYGENSRKTQVEYTNPADVDFVVSTVEIYIDMTGNVTIGAFSGSNPFTSEDYVEVGSLSGGSYRTITGLSIEFKAGQRIGAYSTGQLGLAQSPPGFGRNYNGNAFTGSPVTFSNTYPCCIYGSGEIASVGSKAAMHYYRHLMAGGVGKRC
jgi:hypothetical protein